MCTFKTCHSLAITGYLIRSFVHMEKRMGDKAQPTATVVSNSVVGFRPVKIGDMGVLSFMN